MENFGTACLCQVCAHHTGLHALYSTRVSLYHVKGWNEDDWLFFGGGGRFTRGPLDNFRQKSQIIKKFSTNKSSIFSSIFSIIWENLGCAVHCTQKIIFFCLFMLRVLCSSQISLSPVKGWDENDMLEGWGNPGVTLNNFGQKSQIIKIEFSWQSKC